MSAPIDVFDIVAPVVFGVLLVAAAILVVARGSLQIHVPHQRCL